MLSQRPVLLAVTSLQAGNGGIARVSRLMAKALASSPEMAAGARALSLLDDAIPGDVAVPVTPLSESRARFFFDVQASRAREAFVVYDHVGLGRAHLRLPRLHPAYAVWVHGTELWPLARGEHLRVVRRAHLILSNSQFTVNQLHHYHGSLPDPRICWLGTEDDDAPATSGGTDPPPSVLIVGRIDSHWYKGHRELIDAWPRVVRACPEARLRIVGGGPGLARLREYAANSPAAGQIELSGFVPEDRMPELWHNTTVFAMPSRGEGFGLVYVEAMRYGIPIIASRHDAGAEINLDGVTGITIDLAIPNALADAIVRLLRDPDLAHRMGAAAQEHWHRHFRFSAFRARFLRLLGQHLN